MKISHNMVDWITIVVLAFCLALLADKAFADRYHHHYEPIQNVTEVTNVTELVNTTNIENYTPDGCQGMAMAMASGSNQMYWGTDNPQLSIGVGECGGSLASSVMFGMRVNPKFMLNGAWGADEKTDKNAFSLNATIVFK